MKFLIVGASGFIGSHLFRAAKAAGHDVIGTRAHSPGAELLHFNLSSDRIGDCVSADYLAGSRVIICSAICQIDRCYRQPDVSRRVNVERTIQLIDDVAPLASQIVFLSTSHVFDGTSGNYREEDATNPLSEYGRQKVAVEEYLLGNSASSLILRLDKIISDDPREPQLLTEWWQLIEQGQPIRCIAGQVLSPTLVDDVVQSILTCCRQAQRGLFHVSVPEHCERAELARRFVAALGASTEVVSMPLESFSFADARPSRSYLDSRKLIEATGQHFTSVEETISRFRKRLRS